MLAAIHRVTGRIPRWSEMVLLRNVSAVPSLTDDPGDTLDARGFHLVLVDWRGRITHYAKCRASDDPRAVREGELLVRLAGTSAAACVPRAVVIHQGRLRVLAAEAVVGERLDLRLRRRSADEAQDDAAAILRAMDRIRSVVPTPEPSRSLDAGAELAAPLALLERAGQPADTTALIHAAVQGTWRRQPQHGDLWPGNVIWSAQGPVLLDFESFGEVEHPMFDAWHLVRSTCHARNDHGSWLDVLSPRSAADQQWRNLLDKVQADTGVPGGDLRAGLAWYIVRMAATLLARGVPERITRPYLADVHRVAALLA